jgi:hypothetical protein
MYQQFREVLYHGSVSKIVRVDVTKGRDECCEIEESRGIDALYEFIKIA